jgi:triacylglycerol lipase
MTTKVKHRACALLLATLLAACGDRGGGTATTPPPGLGDTAFDLQTAVTLMQLCLESYQMLADYEAGQTFTLPTPYTLQKQFLTMERFAGETIDGEVPIAFVATRGDAIYVVFRGTKTISEWISDATFSQVDYTYVAGGGKTETGFTDIYATIESQILAEVNALAATGAYSTLYVAGHSLGGALTVVAAPDLAAHTPFPSPVVYGFAGPRAGDPIFAADYDGAIANSWRVVNTNDEAPKVPNAVTVVFGPAPDFKRELFFYEHVSGEYDITFGQPIHSISDLVYDHSSCNYFATLCDQTDDPAQCKQAGQGLDGCDFS